MMVCLASATYLWLTLTVYASTVLSGVRGVRGGNPDAKRLYDDLLSNYNKLVRPVVNNTDALTVRIKIKLSQLIDVNLKNQIMTTNLWVEQFWRDYKLSWDPREYGGVEMLHVPSDHIWRPDIVLYNNADGNFEVTLTTKAILHFDGRVEWKPPAIYKSSCEIDVEYFPFDEQTCVMKFGSWTYSGFQVDLRHMDEVKDSQMVEFGVDLSEFYMSVEWDILEVPAVRNIKFYTCCLEPYIDITFRISMRRKTLFYTVNLIIPCMFISFLTVLVFYLPSDSGEKVTLSISILLSLTVFFLLLAEIIPPTSIAVPLLGKYLLFTMILVTLSICVTVVVLNVHFRSPTTHTMSPWVRRVFIHILPRLLVMRRPQYQQQNRQKFLVRTCNGVELRESYHHLGNMNSPPPPPPPQTSLHHADVAMDTVSGREDSSPYRDCCIHGDGCSKVYQASSVHHHHRPHHQRGGCRSHLGSVRTMPGSVHHDVPTSSSFNENLSLGLADDGVGSSTTCRIHGPTVMVPTSDDYGGTPLSLDDIDERNGAPGMFSPVHCCRSSIHGHHCPEVYRAVEGVRYITEHVKREQDSLKVKEDWKYVAMVLDRLFLWIFTVACVVGTCGIILQAPTLYDKRTPIDIRLSEIATRNIINDSSNNLPMRKS